MKPVEVKLSVPIVAPLLDVVKDLADGLRGSLAVPSAAPESDSDFRSLWTSELLRGQNEDIAALLGLFDEQFFADGAIVFDQDNAEPIARACSSIRLHLRERCLRGVADESLESGDVDLDRLDASVRKAFLCYLFLATLQEVIIQHLDQGVLE